jgi:SSS family solute:Na+ symporter
LNGQGAIASLLVGFVMGATRFVLEVLDKTRHYQPPSVRGLVGMNFLHYSIVMFVVCSMVLIAVSYLYPAPPRKRLAGLTFSTLDEKLESKEPAAPHLARETPRERVLNLFFSAFLIATVVGLWIYFR